MLFFQLCLDVSESREGLPGDWVHSLHPLCRGTGDLSKADCREETWANGETDFLLRLVALWLEVPGLGRGLSLNLSLFLYYHSIKYTW